MSTLAKTQEIVREQEEDIRLLLEVVVLLALVSDDHTKRIKVLERHTPGRPSRV